MSVRAKLVCDAVRQFQNGNNEIDLFPVTGNGGEPDPNGSWSQWTPQGSVKMTITNKEAVGRFDVGAEYYLDFHEEMPQPVEGGVIAKFKCKRKEENDGGYNWVEFMPEWEEDGINRHWSEATPMGEVKLCITNPRAFDYFGAGTFYYLQFTPA